MGTELPMGKLIENLVIDPITNDNIYGIKMFDGDQPLYTTVNNQLPIINNSGFYGVLN